MTELEMRYRRLLSWYPSDHRKAHEDEMVGVLLATAEDGRGRPDTRTVLDLILGGVRLHARRVFGSREWRRALPVLQVTAPLMMLVVAGTISQIAWWSHTPIAWVWAVGWLAVPALAVFRLRRTAAITAWVVLAADLASLVFPDSGGTATAAVGLNAYRLLIVAVAAAALSIPPDPSNGAELRGRHRWLIPGGLAAAGVIGAVMNDPLWTLDDPRALMAFIAFPAAMVVLCFRGPLVRRFALVLFVPFVLGIAGSALSSAAGQGDAASFVSDLSTDAASTLSITVPLVFGFAVVYGVYGLGRLARLAQASVRRT